MNLSCYWSCLHHRLCNMHTICCLHYVVENLEGNIKMTKYVVEWYNSIGLFNKQAYIVPVNPIVIIFYHQQYRICPLKQSLFGWFTYRGFLTATCWNNRNVRVESTAGKTVHKLFVGGVYPNVTEIQSPIDTKSTLMIQVMACNQRDSKPFLEPMWLKSYMMLTHCGLVMPYGDIDLAKHQLR